MLWLDYVRQNGDAYADLKTFLESQKVQTLADFEHAANMDEVNQAKGKVACLVALQLIITQEERADRERAHQADRRTREQRGESRVIQ